jgi:hypothetical protein
MSDEISGLDDEREEALRAHRSVCESIKHFRSRAKNPGRQVAYTEGVHTALVQMLALDLLAIRKLIERVEKLEARPPPSVYRGIWAASDSYEIGDMVTVGGSLWAAVAASKSVRPNTAPACWRLIVKQGRA